MDYLRSLERALAMAPAVLLPSHGEPIHDVERMLRQYIAHRLEREAQILEALADRPRTVDDLLAHIYPAIHPRLQGAARDSIVAHLLKLQSEGRAVESSGVWAPVSPGSTY